MTKKITENEIAERKAFFRFKLENTKSEHITEVRLNQAEFWIDRILDDIIEFPSNYENAVFASAKEAQEAILKEASQQSSEPLRIDEVAHAYFNTYRVENWEVLGEEFGGYKIGAICSFVLELIEQHIGDSIIIAPRQKGANNE